MRFASLVDASHADQLKELLFFNPMQGRYREQICKTVGEYGAPCLEECESGLRITTDKLPDVQNLYALTGGGHRLKIVGALLYYRFVPDTLQILHMAIDPGPRPGSPEAVESVSLSFLGELARISRQISGIEFIRLPYGAKRIPISSLSNL
ncbi:MAG: hypothetical protein WCO94_01655 [Verrucomicrobiota bacterium]